MIFDHLKLFRISDFEFRICNVFILGVLCAFAREYSYFTGRVKKNRLPLPTSLSTQIFPPCISTNFLANASPACALRFSRVSTCLLKF